MRSIYKHTRNNFYKILTISTYTYAYKLNIKELYQIRLNIKNGSNLRSGN